MFFFIKNKKNIKKINQHFGLEYFKNSLNIFKKKNKKTCIKKLINISVQDTSRVV